MNRREFLVRSGALLGGAALAPLVKANALLLEAFQPDANGVRWAEGVVYDLGAPGRVGIPGVAVSNGREIVRTDRNGKWRLPVDENAILFVIKPSGWMTKVDGNNLPQHYYIHKPGGSPDYRFDGVRPTGELPKSIDFGLRRQKEDSKFRMILFGDPQPRDQVEIDYIAHDVLEQVSRDVVNLDAKFGISLGDIMFDNLSLYGSLNRAVGTVGIPWYNVLGNHDMNYDSPDDAGSTETFQATFGPNYYAFDYGRVHFLILDDVWWDGKAKMNYHAELSERQLEFIKNDLAMVPKDRLVVVCMHIPIVEITNKEALFRLIEDRPHCVSLSAHTHVAANLFLGEKDGWKGKAPHHHLNHATVCGSWWQGALDERGIPHATMSDGAPNGYSVVEFDGAKYRVTFRAASRPEQEQMGIWIPELVSVGESEKAEVIVNVWAGSERSVVEMRVGGAWTPMERFSGQDPFFLQMKEIEASPKPPTGRKLPGASTTSHLWKLALPAGMRRGTHAVEVRTTDMYGQTYLDRRLVRVG